MADSQIGFSPRKRHTTRELGLVRSIHGFTNKSIAVFGDEGERGERGERVGERRGRGGRGWAKGER